MINTINVIYMFFNLPIVFVLVKITEPSLYRVSEYEASIFSSIFLPQLFNTWRTYNVTHARDSN